MKITWNTHRMYTAEGQRIHAELHDHCIAFFDQDRGIHGVIDLPPRPIKTALQLQDAVMLAYDYNKYRWGPEGSALHMSFWKGAE